LIDQTPFKLVYDQEAVIPLHLCANAIWIDSILEFYHMVNTLQCFYQLNKLEEERMLAQQHQEIQKIQQKAWHDRHIKKKDINNGYLVLLYDGQVKGKLRNLEISLLGLYVVKDIRPLGAIQFKILQGHPFKKLVNGAYLKRYHTHSSKSLLVKTSLGVIVGLD